MGGSARPGGEERSRDRRIVPAAVLADGRCCPASSRGCSVIAARRARRGVVVVGCGRQWGGCAAAPCLPRSPSASGGGTPRRRRRTSRSPRRSGGSAASPAGHSGAGGRWWSGRVSASHGHVALSSYSFTASHHTVTSSRRCVTASQGPAPGGVCPRESDAAVNRRGIGGLHLGPRSVSSLPTGREREAFAKGQRRRPQSSARSRVTDRPSALAWHLPARWHRTPLLMFSSHSGLLKFGAHRSSVLFSVL